MAGQLFILLCALHLHIILIADAVKIEFFRNSNFTELVLEHNSTGNCTNVSLFEIYSIRTDTCFIAYADEGCKSVVSGKFLPGDFAVFAHSAWWTYWMKSVRICNEEEGGNQLNVDITKYFDDYYPSDPDVLESYKNVCSCVNIPYYVQIMEKWSINNHHNSLMAYYHTGCLAWKLNPELIHAGRHLDSQEIIKYKRVDPLTNTTYKIQSFGPDPNSAYFQTSCDAGFQILSKQVMELQTKQRVDINKLTNAFAQLQNQLGNLSTQIKSDLYELFA